MNTHVFYYKTPIGQLGIAENGQAITNLFFDGTTAPSDFILKETELLKVAATQLSAYFAGTLKDFDLPLSPQGTHFQKSVYTQLCTIPYGQTASYKEVAVKIGKPKAYRAVGNANNKNPIPIFIPCHRVIGSSGKLVGFGGGIQVKDYLLKLEKKQTKPKVAFICVHNSCRSQIAQALCTHLASDVLTCYSAGTHIKSQINQDAVRLMKKIYRIDMEKTQSSKLISAIPTVDIVVTMGCSVQCPILPCIHREDWGLADPTGKSDAEFIQIIEQIHSKVLDLAARVSNKEILSQQ